MPLRSSRTGFRIPKRDFYTTMQMIATEPQNLPRRAVRGLWRINDTPVVGACELTDKPEYLSYTTPADVSQIHQLEQLNDQLSDSNNQGRSLADL